MPGPQFCVECQMDGVMPPPPKKRTEVSTPWPARFDAYCTGCHLTISTGQMIVRRVRFVGNKVHSESYVHEGCA